MLNALSKEVQSLAYPCPKEVTLKGAYGAMVH